MNISITVEKELDSLSRNLSRDATKDQAHELWIGTEAKYTTENNDEAGDTEWPNHPRAGEGKGTVTH